MKGIPFFPQASDFAGSGGGACGLEEEFSAKIDGRNCDGRKGGRDPNIYAVGVDQEDQGRRQFQGASMTSSGDAARAWTRQRSQTEDARTQSRLAIRGSLVQTVGGSKEQAGGRPEPVMGSFRRRKSKTARGSTELACTDLDRLRLPRGR